LVGLLLASPVALGAWSVKREGRYFIIETRHYKVSTDISAKMAQIIARHMEAVYAEYYRRMAGVSHRRSGKRFQVVVFKNGADYAGFVGAGGINSRGIFIWHRNTLASFGTEGDLDLILRVLRHEGFHQFAIAFIGYKIPIWLNEGMAVFFENSEWSEGRLKIGLVPAGRLATLKRARADNQLIPLRKMLLLSNEEWSMNIQIGTQTGTLQYAQAWSMVHFLVYGDKGRYRRHLELYISKIAGGQTHRQAFEKVFGGDVAGFEKRWLAYIDSLKVADYVRCRHHLTLLLQLLDANRERPEIYKDMKTFYEAVVNQKLGQWEAWTPDGLGVKSDDTKAIKRLFLCPKDSSRKKPYSYEFAPAEKDSASAKAGLPDIICRHHSGMIYRGTFVKDEVTGELEPRVLTLPAGPKKSRVSIRDAKKR